MRTPFFVLLLISSFAMAQESTFLSKGYFDTHLFYGNLLKQNKNVAHLVEKHPSGLIISYNHKTRGEKFWQRTYNLPDWGISFVYQDYHTNTLGEALGIYGHYNFYLFNRTIQLRLAQGIGYGTRPFDIDSNFKNVAYSSSLMASSYVLFNYYQKQIFDNIGLQLGLAFMHHSNGSFKAPNAGTNVIAFNLGLTYDQTENVELLSDNDTRSIDYREPLKLNLFVRGGVNEGDFIGLGQHPFAIFGVALDKRLNYKSTIQFGSEIFFSKFLEKEIEYQSISFGPQRATGDEDYKRIGLFLGHEFRIGSFAIPTQLGYYVYWPYEYESRVYSRIGVGYYFTNNWYAMATVKTHSANAEAIEFGMGIRI